MLIFEEKLLRVMEGDRSLSELQLVAFCYYYVDVTIVMEGIFRLIDSGVPVICTCHDERLLRLTNM
jgi:hypothetical protein